MANFNKALTKFLASTSEYEQYKLVDGREKYKGISKSLYPNWHGWIVINEFKNIATDFPEVLEKDTHLQDYVRDFLLENCWDQVAGSFIDSQEVAEELFDIAVKFSSVTAAAWLQKSINLLSKKGESFPQIEVTGEIGTNTFHVLNTKCNWKCIMKCLYGFRFMVLTKLSENYPEEEIMFTNWLLQE